MDLVVTFITMKVNYHYLNKIDDFQTVKYGKKIIDITGNRIFAQSSKQGNRLFTFTGISDTFSSKSSK